MRTIAGGAGLHAMLLVCFSCSLHVGYMMTRSLISSERWTQYYNTLYDWTDASTQSYIERGVVARAVHVVCGDGTVRRC